MIILKTLGGKDLTRYDTYLERGSLRGHTGERETTSAARASRYPVYTGGARKDRTVGVVHLVDLEVLESELERLEGEIYDPEAGAQVLIFEENGVEKFLYAVAEQLQEHPDNEPDCSGEFGMYRGTWRLLEQDCCAVAETTTPTVTASGDSTDIVAAVGGTITSRRVRVTLTPGSQKDSADGQRWRWLITLVNRTARPTLSHAVEITDGQLGSSLSNGWPHDDEVGAAPARSLATGYDVEAYAGGRRMSRWTFPAGGRTWDEHDTGLFIVPGLPEGRWWTLRADVAAGDTALPLEEILGELPEAPPFYAAICTNSVQEVVLVTGSDEGARVLTVRRGKRDTDAADWDAGTMVYWVAPAGLVDLVHGWLEAPEPNYISDDLKPVMLDGANDTSNAHFVFASFYETDPGDPSAFKPRSGSWLPSAFGAYDRERKTGDGDQFWRYVPTSEGNPGTAVGLEYQQLGARNGRDLMDRWDYFSPIAFDAFDLDYDATNLDIDDREAELAVYYIEEGGNVVLHGKYSGSSSSLSVTLSTPAVGLSLRVEPFDPKTDDAQNTIAGEPADGDSWKVSDLSVDFVTDQQIVAIQGGQRRAVYQVGRPDAPAILSNGAGEQLEIYGVLLGLDEALVIDGYAGTAVVGDGTGRAHLLRGMLPGLPADLDGGPYPDAGEATLTYEEAGATDLAIDVVHRDAWD